MRVPNFSPGPAALPLPALERARAELLDFAGSGMSVMEQSHRGKVYERVHAQAQERVARLLSLPPSHQVLFVTGGASLHFAWVPMNFLHPGRSADYVMTGNWSEKAFDEARLVGSPRVAATSRQSDGQYRHIPLQLELDPQAAYLHLTSNNTIEGTQFQSFPEAGGVPLVCDMSSDMLARPLDVSRFGLIYAGAQKNLGPSGIVLAIARRDWLATGRTDIPKILRYQTHAENDSLYNTPNTWGVYLINLTLEWMESLGGLAVVEARNQAKAHALYAALEALQGFYSLPVEPGSRSVMNVVFRCPTPQLDARFATESEAAGLVGLKGHRLVGGLRASLYNAVSLQDVEALVAFARHFAARHG